MGGAQHTRGRAWAWLLAGLAACASPGRMTVAPARVAPAAAPCLELPEALSCFAPVLIQEQAEPPHAWDTPQPLDADGSGTLADDWKAAPSGAPTYYAAARGDARRLYLFYGLYYAADWSGPRARPRLDHAGDFEGALVVVARGAGRVEAVVTQAHGRFHLWWGSSLGLSADGRPLLFAEGGGHGLYAFGHGRWKPHGGRFYPEGTAAVDRARLTRPSPALRPLSDLAAFTAGPDGPFRGLDHASPPWRWPQGGAIVRDPARFYAALSAAASPPAAPGAGRP